MQPSQVGGPDREQKLSSDDMDLLHNLLSKAQCVHFSSRAQACCWRFAFRPRPCACLLRVDRVIPRWLTELRRCLLAGAQSFALHHCREWADRARQMTLGKRPFTYHELRELLEASEVLIPLVTSKDVSARSLAFWLAPPLRCVGCLAEWILTCVLLLLLRVAEAQAAADPREGHPLDHQGSAYLSS